jgi:SEC-C motif domain protein
MKFDKCPCGSGVQFSLCCGALLAGERRAETAEQLMRSRYSAYVTRRIDYLVDTTWPESREPNLEATIRSSTKKVDWVKLHVIACQDGKADDAEGRVEFIAEYVTDQGVGQHHECSYFRQKDGRWYYVSEEFEE